MWLLEIESGLLEEQPAAISQAPRKNDISKERQYASQTFLFLLCMHLCVHMKAGMFVYGVFNV